MQNPVAGIRCFPRLSRQCLMHIKSFVVANLYPAMCDSRKHIITDCYFTWLDALRLVELFYPKYITKCNRVSASDWK
jgi:hypothetical protein